MPRRTDITSILIIGTGPIAIRQACEVQLFERRRSRLPWVDDFRARPRHVGEVARHQRHAECDCVRGDQHVAFADQLAGALSAVLAVVPNAAAAGVNESAASDPQLYCATSRSSWNCCRVARFAASAVKAMPYRISACTIVESRHASKLAAIQPPTSGSGVGLAISLQTLVSNQHQIRPGPRRSYTRTRKGLLQSPGG